MIPLNDLSRAQDLSNGELAEMFQRVLQSGHFILGEMVRAFESKMLSVFNFRDVCAVGSGTEALILALKALDLPKGAKVATTPNAGGYSTVAILECGLLPHYVDCLEDGGMDPESLETALGQDSEIRGVIVTHLYGKMCDVEILSSICQVHEVLMVEDCAQAIGASVTSGYAGSFGDIATFSFFPTKNLGALGDAGALASMKPDFIQRARELRQYGWRAKYEVSRLGGLNSRMDELQASVLLNRLGKLDRQTSIRRNVWIRYQRELFGSEWKLIGSPGKNFVAHLAVIVCPPGLRDASRSFLESSGVGTAIHYPILDYRQVAWTGLNSGACPTAEDLVQRILTVPLFPELTESEVSKVSSTLAQLRGALD